MLEIEEETATIVDELRKKINKRFLELNELPDKNVIKDIKHFINNY